MKNKTMFIDGLGKPIRLGQPIFINGQPMIVKYGKHFNDTVNWLHPDKDRKMMYGWYAASECGSWEVNLYSKKDQIESLNERITKNLVQQEIANRERMFAR